MPTLPGSRDELAQRRRARVVQADRARPGPYRASRLNPRAGCPMRSYERADPTAGKVAADDRVDRPRRRALRAVRGGLPHAARALPRRATRDSTRPTGASSATSATPGRSAATTHGARVRKRLDGREPDVVIGTDAATWLALRRGALVGHRGLRAAPAVRARQPRPRRSRFEGLFRLPNGREPLLRMHDVQLPAAGASRR